MWRHELHAHTPVTTCLTQQHGTMNFTHTCGNRHTHQYVGTMTRLTPICEQLNFTPPICGEMNFTYTLWRLVLHTSSLIGALTQHFDKILTRNIFLFTASLVISLYKPLQTWIKNLDIKTTNVLVGSLIDWPADLINQSLNVTVADDALFISHCSMKSLTALTTNQPRMRHHQHLPKAPLEKTILNMKRNCNWWQYFYRSPKIYFIYFTPTCHTVEPRFAEPLYNRTLDITNDSIYSNSQICEKKTQYNETSLWRTYFASPKTLYNIEVSLCICSQLMKWISAS